MITNTIAVRAALGALALGLGVIGAAQIIHSQEQGKTRISRDAAVARTPAPTLTPPPNTVEAFPIVDLNAPPADSSAVDESELAQDEQSILRRRQRLARREHFSLDLEMRGQPENVTRERVRQISTITDDSQTRFGGFESDAGDEPALPAKSADVVVRGTVLEASANLGLDKTSVFSEFTISPIEFFKNAGALPADAELVAMRYGGRIRLASGHVITHGFMGREMPRIRGEYVFFLKAIPSKSGDVFSYEIITAYQLTEADSSGKRIVVPLDGINPHVVVAGANGQPQFGPPKVVTQLAAHQSWRGESAETFVEVVRGAVKMNADLSKRIGVTGASGATVKKIKQGGRRRL